MAGKFELYKDKAGKFRFRLKASNGEIILASQGYASKAGARKGIASVQKHSRQRDCFKVSTTRANKHRFNLVANNGKTVATSESYSSKVACGNGIKSVQRHAPKAKVLAA